MPRGARQLFEFGPFRVDGAERQLSCNGKPVALTDKVFDLLLLLVQNQGHVLSKAELMAELWPDTVVEENNLTVNMSALRKALGERASDRRYVETLSRRGYRFIGEVRRPEARAPAPVERYAATFVGREGELDRLRQLLSGALLGRGRVVFITGSPGMGKSELAEQFVLRAHAEHEKLLVATGRCLEQYGTGEAYLPFLDALSSLLHGAEEGLVSKVLRQHAPTWCAQLPGALSAHDAPESRRGDAAPTNSARMLREMGDALEALSLIEPLVLLLEDLHWADPSSSDLLRLLGQRAGRCRLLVIATCRAEQLELESHPLLNIRREMLAHDQCEDLVLPLLGGEGISRYLDARFSPHAFPAELGALITRTTEGQPLFATRLVQLLVERGDIIQEGGLWRLGRALDELHLGVPDSVRGLIQKKLESLGREDARALSYASVIGAEFSSVLLASLLGVDEILLEERLDHLARAQRWVEPLGDERLSDGRLSVRYRFSHVLYQNVLYQSVVSGRRVQLHAQVAELLVSQHGARANLHAAPIAAHFEHARQLERAIPFLMHAADNAGRLHANREALQYYSRAFGLVPELPLGARVAYEIILRYNRGWCAFHLADYEAALTEFQSMGEQASAKSFTSTEGEAARDAVFDYFKQPWKDSFGIVEPPRIPNQRRELVASDLQCEALWAQCETLLHAERLEEMGVRAERLLHLAEATNNQPRRAEALAWLALRQIELSNLNEATRFTEQTLPLARSLGHNRALCVACWVAARVHYLRAEYEQAEALTLEALALSYEASGRVECLWGLGLTRAHLGRMSEALAALREATHIAQQAGYDYHAQMIPNSIGSVYLELGDLERAISIAREGAAQGARQGLTEGEARSWVNLVLCYTRTGELAEAEAALAQVEALVQRGQGRHGRALSSRQGRRLEMAKSEYLLARGDHERARASGRALLEMATRQRSPKDVATARLLMASAELGLGDEPAAERELRAGLAALHDHPTPLLSWKLLAALGCARSARSDRAAALEAFERALEIVSAITQGITGDEALRAKWLGSAPVRALQTEAAACELAGRALEA